MVKVSKMCYKDQNSTSLTDVNILSEYTQIKYSQDMKTMLKHQDPVR